MIKNKDVVFEIRDLLFRLNKAYAELEDDTHILNNSKMDMHTFKYLEKVTEIMEIFYTTSLNLRKHYLLLCSEDEEDKND